MGGSDWAHWQGFFELQQDLYKLEDIYEQRMKRVRSRNKISAPSRQLAKTCFVQGFCYLGLICTPISPTDNFRSLSSAAVLT